MKLPVRNKLKEEAYQFRAADNNKTVPDEEQEVKRSEDDDTLLPDEEDDQAESYDNVELEDGHNDLNTPDSNQGVDSLE